MAFKLSYQDKLALMMTLFQSQRQLAAAMGVSHQRVGRWLREGQPATIDPETGDQLKSAGIKKIPDESHVAIDTLFTIYKQIAKDQAKAYGVPYDSRIPVFLNRPEMRNGDLGMRIYAESTEYIRRDVRINFFAIVQESEKFIQASVRSEINIFSYIQATPAESQQFASARATKSRQRKYQKAHFQNSAEGVIQAGGRLMPVFTRYENISPGTSVRLSITNIERKIERHAVHATKSADQWLFQLKTPPQRNETPRKKRTVQRKNRR